MPDSTSVTRGFSTTGRASSGDSPRRRLLLPALTILGHPDLDRIGDRVLLGELAKGQNASVSRQGPRFSTPGVTALGEPLADRFLSRGPILLAALDNGDVRIDRGTSRTAVTVQGKAVERSHRVDAASVTDGVVIGLADRVTLLLHRHPATCEQPDGGFGMVGASAALAEVRASIRRLAEFDVPVLVRGETGSGKELVARALHEHGPRRHGPFISVSLAALPATLAASELFGAKKGAFTGAVQDRKGYFERADGGTLFLDEIGEAPTDIQVMLLRALETGQILPAGGSAPKRVDVRVVSATDADLETLAVDGAFREPLLHRLAGYTLKVPPLRARRDDIGRLLAHFLRRELDRIGDTAAHDPSRRESWLPSELMTRLIDYHWPGNVRQLANIARQLLIDGRDRPSLVLTDRIRALLVGGPVASSQEGVEPVAPEPPPVRRKPSKIPDQEVVAALRRHGFNLKSAAAELGIARTSLYSLIQRSPVLRAAADIPAEEIEHSWQRHHGDLDAMVVELEISERALRQRLKDLGLR